MVEGLSFYDRGAVAEDAQSLPERANAIVRNPHLWIIVALTVVLTTSYYADYSGLSWVPTSKYTHEVLRTLFLIPMFYAAIAFHFRGALITSFVFLCIVLPYTLFASHPEPMFSVVTFIIVASLATITLGLEEERRQKEKKALSELDTACRELQDNAKLLKTSEARYRDLFNNASDAIFISDLKGNVIDANQSATALTGYTTEELIKMTFSQLFSAKSFKTAIESQRRQIRGEAITERYDVELIRKDGTKAIVEPVTRLITKEGKRVGILGIIRDVTEQRQLQESMQFYITEVIKAQEGERKRIARELHDETAQTLASLLLDVEVINKSRDQLSDETIQYLEQHRLKIDSLLKEVRSFSHALRPPVLDQMGLIPVMELLVDKLNEQEKVNAYLEVSGSERRLSPDTELVLFRIAQESLRNVMKHSQSTEAVVRIEFGPENVRLEITDNGRGFELPKSPGNFVSMGKLGLIGMQERARLLDSRLSVESQVGKGTKIAIEVTG